MKLDPEVQVLHEVMGLVAWVVGDHEMAELVYAASEEEARQMIRDFGPEPDLADGDVSRREEMDGCWPEPGVVDDLVVLREARFREDGESTCDTCGRAALGEPAWKVCDDCAQCLECGCDC